MTLSTFENFPHLENIILNYFPVEIVSSIVPVAIGNVNETFLIKTIANNGFTNYILQCLNSKVFSDPRLVNSNFVIISEHIRLLLSNHRPPFLADSRWQSPHLISPLATNHNYLEVDGKFWRMMSYIDKTVNLTAIPDQATAYEVGKGLAIFHQLLHDIDHNKLYNILPNFHKLPYYLSKYDSAKYLLSKFSDQENYYSRLLILDSIIQSNLGQVSVVEQAIQNNELQFSFIHGDPKLSNFLFDKFSRKVVSLIDLDTVSLGPIIFDLSDCLRSCCNFSGEDPIDIETVFFDLDLGESILRGYLPIDPTFLTPRDYHYLAFCIASIPFELGIRFLTDFLNKDIYFTSDYYSHNLYRSEVQFKLFKSVLKQWDPLLLLIHSIGS